MGVLLLLLLVLVVEERAEKLRMKIEREEVTRPTPFSPPPANWAT